MKLARALASLAVVAVVACGGGDDVIESEKIDSPTTEIGTEPPEVETDLPEIPDTDDGDDTEGGDSDTDDTEGGDSDSDTDDTEGGDSDTDDTEGGDSDSDTDDSDTEA